MTRMGVGEQLCECEHPRSQHADDTRIDPLKSGYFGILLNAALGSERMNPDLFTQERWTFCLAPRDPTHEDGDDPHPFAYVCGCVDFDPLEDNPSYDPS